MSPRLYKRGRTWYSDILIGGKRVRKPLAYDRRVAEERLADLVKERGASLHGYVQSDIAWDAFKTKYIEATRSKAPATQSRERAALKDLERFHLPRKLTDITPELLERWKSSRKADGRGNATINRDLRAIKRMMRVAYEWGYIKEWRGSLVKKLKETPGRLLFYSPQEVRTLLGVCRSRFSAFYDWETVALLGLRAGLRRAEIYWLAWQDVELKRRTISITPKDGWQPKDSEQRHIPIPEDLTQHLALKRKMLGNSRWVIGDERPSLPVLSAFFRKISRKAKLSGNIHTLRHTYASWLVQSGASLRVIADLLGHSDIRQTMMYAHVGPHALEDAVKRMPRL